MPARSKQQLKLIYARRDMYKSKENTPEKWKWIWNSEWEDVDYDKLPDKLSDSFLSFYKEQQELVKESITKKVISGLLILTAMMGAKMSRYFPAVPGKWTLIRSTEKITDLNEKEQLKLLSYLNKKYMQRFTLKDIKTGNPDLSKVVYKELSI